MIYRDDDRQPRTHRVAVYGSLRMGMGNHRIIASGRLVGLYETAPRFTMHSLGAFPGVTDGGNTAIKVEAYDVDDATLARLDALEGHPDFYQRARVLLRGGAAGSGATVAWIYILRASHLALGRWPVPGGDWVAHLGGPR